MSTEANTALEKPNSGVAAIVPEGALEGLPEVQKDYGIDSFWKEEGAPEKPADKPASTEPAKDESKAEATDALRDSATSLGSRWGAKVKAPEKDVKDLIKPKAEEKQVVTDKTTDKPEDFPEDKIQLDSRASKTTSEHFKALKEISKAERAAAAKANAELAALRAEYEATKKAPGVVDTTELERIKTEHKAAMDRLLVLDTKNHPAFKAQYVAPREEALAQAKELLDAHGKQADLRALLDKPRAEVGKAMEEILKDLPSMDRTEVADHFRKAYKLARDEETALKNARDVNGQITQQELSSHSQAFEKTWGRVAQTFAEHVKPIEVPKGVTLDSMQRAALESYNAAMSLQAIQEDARKIATGTQSMESISEHAIKAAMYERHINHVLPRIGQEFNAMQEIIRGLKAEVEGYRSRNPNRDISSKPDTSTAPTKAPSSYEEAWDSAVSSRK